MDTSTELRLGLPGTEESVSTVSVSVPRGNKRPISGDSDECNSRFVGWPPVRTFRKNKFQCRPKITKSTITAGDTCKSSPGLFVKVGMDGVPYLRKIDLKVYTGYKELRQALDTMFKCFSVEFTVAYEDKDGDWMLAGDVPWKMFVCSCKRLRIMKDQSIN